MTHYLICIVLKKLNTEKMKKNRGKPQVHYTAQNLRIDIIALYTLFSITI